MKIVTFGPRGDECPGAIRADGTIVSVTALLAASGRTPLAMNALIGSLDLLLPDLQEHLEDADLPVVNTHEVRIGPPVPDPEKIIVVGGNYQSYVDELYAVTGGVAPETPILVLKPSNTVIGYDDPLVRPLETEKLDYETELAIIIGRSGHRIPASKAMEHVAGYAIANDVTARDVMMGEVEKSPLYMQLTRGKGFPTFLPLGPWLVSRDEVSSPNDLDIRCWINGELRQSASTSDMILDVPGVIETVSSTMHLSPGDVVLTGTPAGVGATMDPPLFLEPGDVIEMEIGGLGRLRTHVVAEEV